MIPDFRPRPYETRPPLPPIKVWVLRRRRQEARCRGCGWSGAFEDYPTLGEVACPNCREFVRVREVV